MHLRLTSNRAASVGRVLRIRAVLALALMLPGVLAPAAVDAAKVTGIVVDDSGAAIGDPLPFGKCGAPNYNTIDAAVTFAENNYPALPVILVCAGNYPESSIEITRPLRILGAQWGKDARNGRTNVSKESVLNHDGSEFGFYLNDDNITIDGFTIQKVSAPAGGIGVAADDGYAGHQILNNIFMRHVRDVSIGSADNGNQSVVRRNFFKNVASNASPPDPSASLVAISNDLLDMNDVLIQENRFTLHTEEAIFLDGTLGNTVDNVTIQSNQLVLDLEISLHSVSNVGILNNLISRGRGNGILVSGSTGIAISGNQVERNRFGGLSLDGGSAANDDVEVLNNTFTRNGLSAVFVVDNNTNVTVHDNTMQDNGGAGIEVQDGLSALFLVHNQIRRNGDNGVKLDNSTLVTVRDSSIRGNRLDGVSAINGTTSVTIQNNDLFDNTSDGISLDSTTSNITLTLNEAKDNVEYDCHDGTGPPSVNFWALSNQGKTQNQPGLCNGAQTVLRVR